MRFLVNKIRKIDNKGAAMVTILVAISFLAIMGAILLFTAFMGYRIKAAQAIGENRFYDAETAMNEIRAGLQGKISTTIADSYTAVMYGFEGVNDIDLEFMHLFKYDLLGTNTDPTSSDYLFTLGVTETVDTLFVPVPAPPNAGGNYKGTGLSFNLAFLEEFITDTSGATTLSLNGNNQLGRRDIRGEWVLINPADNTSWQYIITEITLRGLRVEHISDEDYLSVVETDISFNMPNLAFQRNLFSFREIADYAFIATDRMDNGAAANVMISGSAYVGYAEFRSGRLTIGDGGTFISGGRGINGNLSPNPNNNGDINVLVGQELNVNPGSSVWANNIRVGSSSSAGVVNLNGNTYAAASLILSGNNSTAALSGRYFGIGTGFNPYNSALYGSEYSSSIIVNSRNNKLDLSGLNYLFLAGQSFISASTENVLTGQSMAVKSDQLAYLIPAEYIIGMSSNPMVHNSDTFPVFEIDFDRVLWTTSEGQMRLSDYIDSSGAPVPNGVHPIIIPIPNTTQYLVYLFMRFTGFTDPANPQQAAIDEANKYFRDYFENDILNIKNYIGIYLDEYESATNQRQTGSNIYDSTPEIDLGAAFTGGNVISSSLTNEYLNRRRTLSSAPVSLEPWHDAVVNNPFDFVVKGKYNASAGTIEYPPIGAYYDADGKLRAVVHSGPLSLNSFGSDINDIRIIICYGDVTVNTEFTGLILCQGNITVSNNVTAGKAELADALKALHSVSGERLGDYLNIKIDEDGTDDPTGINAWALSELVYYSNWRKG